MTNIKMTRIVHLILVLKDSNRHLCFHIFKSEDSILSLQYSFQDEMKTSLLPQLLKNLEATAKTPCGTVRDIFSMRVSQFINHDVKNR